MAYPDESDRRRWRWQTRWMNLLQVLDMHDDADDAFSEDRVLCPDGACIGVIGKTGRCSQCGRPAEETSTDAPSPAIRDADAELSRDRDGDDDEAPALDEDRELCPDGSCVGLIGEERRCKVCGRAAE